MANRITRFQGFLKLSKPFLIWENNLKIGFNTFDEHFPLAHSGEKRL